MKTSTFFLFLILMTPCLFASRIGILPFSNKSKYKGGWYLEKDVPVYLEKCLNKTYNVIPFDSIYSYLKKNTLTASNLDLPVRKKQVAKHINADFLISGEIEDFLVRKRIIGEGRYGGIKSYAAESKIEIKVYSTGENRNIYRDVVEVDEKENTTAVNLGRLSKDEMIFDSLRTASFGSDVFEKSVAGKMMRSVCSKVCNIILRLPEPVAKKGESRKVIKLAKIVDITETDVYINAGLEDRVETGDIFRVFTKKDSVKDPDTGEFLGVSEKYIGKIRILFVEASHFSRAEIIEKKEKFKLMDIVRIEK